MHARSLKLQLILVLIFYLILYIQAGNAVRRWVGFPVKARRKTIEHIFRLIYRYAPWMMCLQAALAL
jgi:hypothetical protein